MAKYPSIQHCLYNWRPVLGMGGTLGYRDVWLGSDGPQFVQVDGSTDWIYSRAGRPKATPNTSVAVTDGLNSMTATNDIHQILGDLYIAGADATGSAIYHKTQGSVPTANWTRIYSNASGGSANLFQLAPDASPGRIFVVENQGPSVRILGADYTDPTNFSLVTTGATLGTFPAFYKVSRDGTVHMATTINNVFVSTDGGVNFAASNPPNQSGTDAWHAVEHTVELDRWVAMSEEGVVYSDNDGGTWIASNFRNTGVDVNITDLGAGFETSSDGRLINFGLGHLYMLRYYSDSSLIIWNSRDGGASWYPIDTVTVFDDFAIPVLRTRTVIDGGRVYLFGSGTDGTVFATDRFTEPDYNKTQLL